MSAKKPCESSGYVLGRAGDFAHASVSQTMESCGQCSSGLLRATIEENGRTYEVSKPCPRTQLVKRADLFNAMHLPGVLANATFATFQSSKPEQAKALRLAQDFAFRYPQGTGFVLSGPVGTGKTHLLASTLKHLTLELGIRCSYVEISLLYSQIRRGFNEGKSGGEIIGPLSQVEVLAIDEIGKGRGSAFEMETLDELIARRYNAGRATLFATNYSVQSAEARQGGYIDPGEAIAASKESRFLSDRVGARIYSRLSEMCAFVEFPKETSDMRRIKFETRGSAGK